MGILSRLRAAAAAFRANSAYATDGVSRRALAIGRRNGGPNVNVHSLGTLRDQSHDAVRKNAVADSAVSGLVTNIIGTGIQPKFSTPDSGLNRELGELFFDWTDEADADGCGDFYAQQALAVRAMVEGGEAFVRFRLRRLSDGLIVPLQLQVLEGEFCAETENRENGANTIAAGIETDPIGRRVAYWMYRSHPNDPDMRLVDNSPRAIAASEIAHLYERRRPGQMRGEPWLSRALVKLSDLDKYDDAELIRKQVASMLVGFRRRPVPDGMTSDDLKALWGEAAEVDDGVGYASLEPGTMQDLDPGEDVTFTAPPSDAGGSYEAFMRVQFRAVAMSAGLLYEQVIGDWSQANDRTLRAALNEFRRRCAMWQHHLVAFQLCRPVHGVWLRSAIASGAIRPPRGMSQRDLFRVRWIPQGWPYINPTQDIQAARDEIRAGLTSRAAKIAERGDDIEQIDAEQAASNARADDLGLSFDSDGRRALNDPTKEAGAGTVAPDQGA